ncbi:MAG: RNA polymerase factor sigma-54 [Spirochaetales bacterium]|nr:RNA polymerase factor sigma-54 [Spirochaetales bacterium]
MQYQRPVMVQEQKLKMSPQLYQSIQLMALPVQDLKQKIEEELERNPALEVVEDKSQVSLEDVPDSANRDDYDAFENTSDPGYINSRGAEASDSKQKFLEGALSRPESLQDHLLWQLRVQPISPKHFAIGERVIQNLNENGFHLENPENMVSENEIPLLNEMIAMIRQFDPVGTCTSGFIESLLVQIEIYNEAPAWTKEIVSGYFVQLEKGKHQEIAKALGITKEEVLASLEYIKTLDPFPGRRHSTETARYVIPDLMVKVKEGEFILVLNDEEIPVLGVNRFFEEMMASERNEKDVKRFVSQNVKDARWFIRSIHQRNNTLLKISKAIVEFQRSFFIRGPKFLAPLTLKDIAQEVDVHETTVSRISNKKYIQTEWGIFELKHFFSNSISGTGSGGSRFSKEGVKEIIREILEGNSGGKSLSDQKIADILKGKGINLARRTVAKYRNELDIASSYER